MAGHGLHLDAADARTVGHAHIAAHTAEGVALARTRERVDMQPLTLCHGLHLVFVSVMGLDRLVEIDGLVYVLGNELERGLPDGRVAAIYLKVVGIAAAGHPAQANGIVLLLRLQRIHLDDVVEVELGTCTILFRGGQGLIIGKTDVEL